MKNSYKIVLAEDHTILRQGLKALMAARPNMEIKAEAKDGLEAIRLTALHNPDLLLMDLSMPRMNGLEALKEIKKQNPETKVIVLTVHKTEEYVLAALERGADGYVLKDADQAELFMAIEQVLSGKRYLSPAISGQVIEGYVEGRKLQKSTSSWDSLTDREREVMKLVAEGHKNKEIADYLCISLKTVEKHRTNLMNKLDLHNTAALTALAMEKGLITR